MLLIQCSLRRSSTISGELCVRSTRLPAEMAEVDSPSGRTARGECWRAVAWRCAPSRGSSGGERVVRSTPGVARAGKHAYRTCSTCRRRLFRDGAPHSPTCRVESHHPPATAETQTLLPYTQNKTSEHMLQQI